MTSRVKYVWIVRLLKDKIYHPIANALRCINRTLMIIEIFLKFLYNIYVNSFKTCLEIDWALWFRVGNVFQRVCLYLSSNKVKL